MIFDQSLQNYLDYDKSICGVDPITQVITTLDHKLTWKALVETGTLSFIEKRAKLSAEKIIKDTIPAWLPVKFNTYVITRTSFEAVVTRVYVALEEKDE